MAGQARDTHGPAAWRANSAAACPGSCRGLGPHRQRAEPPPAGQRAGGVDRQPRRGAGGLITHPARLTPKARAGRGSNGLSPSHLIMMASS